MVTALDAGFLVASAGFLSLLSLSLQRVELQLHCFFLTFLTYSPWLQFPGFRLLKMGAGHSTGACLSD